MSILDTENSFFDACETGNKVGRVAPLIATPMPVFHGRLM